MKQKIQQLVKIRREKRYFLAYFIEYRKILLVNEIGARILELFFNENKSILEIAEFFMRGGKKYKKSDIKNNIRKFLKKVAKELDKRDSGEWPIIEGDFLETPIGVELQINTTCNLRCKHCFQSNYSRIMPFSRIKNILSLLYKNNIFEINLVGGEPFLHPNIFEIIEMCCKKYNFAVNVITNGTLLTSKIINLLSKHRDKIALLISLEGVKDTNDLIRGRGTFKKVERTIKKLKKKRIYFEFSFTLNALNIKYWKQFLLYAHKLKAPCNFNLFKPFSNKQKYLVIHPFDYFEFINELFIFKKIKKIETGITDAAIWSYVNKLMPRNQCKATLTGLNINAKGEMVPCAFFDEVGYYKNLPTIDKNFLKNWKYNYWFKDFRKYNLRECQFCSYIFNKSRAAFNPYGLSAFKKWQRIRQ
ncbi:MAG: radical SAM protein [Patescibacteria group bacterium]|jgi:radical SAM protein with 4Fe4S-binding SPASM domain|nr:radical SAM protein [Patescibacteria group bacterium]